MADEAKGALATREDGAVAGALDASTARMMELAIGQGEAGVAALERLVALRERQEEAEAKRQHAAALAAAQAEFPAIRRGRRGAHGAAYADLDDIMHAVGPALTAHGLSVTYDSEELDGGRMRITCIVRHAGGHESRAAFTVSREKPSNRMNDTQRDGSASTYGRRYALGLALGITTGERDDDGQSAAPGPALVTEQQATDLRALAEDVGADVPAFLAWAGTDTFAGVPASRYAQAVRLLERKRQEGGA